MQRLWLKITGSYLILSITFILVLWFFISSIIQNTYTDMTEDHLIENAQLVSEVITLGGLDEDRKTLDEWTSHFNEEITLRYTIIGKDGTVIADSESDIETMDNHIDRPEIDAVLVRNQDVGSSTRLSDTKDTSMMYVATPVKADGEIIGAVRTSITTESIDNAISAIWTTLSAILFIILLVSVISAALLSYNITKPINRVINVTKRLQNKDYSARINADYSGEIGNLNTSVNALAASLQAHVNEIEESEKQLNSILSNLVSGVVLIDDKGFVDLTNHATERFLSKHTSKITGKEYSYVFGPLGIDHLIETVIEDNVKRHDEAHIYFPEERILDVHIAPYYSQGWHQRGAIIVMHDITNIRRLEKMRSEFVANVSHELKTPITSVKGFAETLLSGDVPDKETSDQFLRIIYDESERLNRLITDLLELSKIEKQAMPLQITDVNVNEIINNSTQTISKFARDKNITLHLPEIDEAVHVEADKDRLGQIVLNLVANAVNYTADNGAIFINVEERTSKVVISVRDTGMGIPAESLDRLFERFYRVDQARSRHSGGTGLGLAIVKHLVESHGGNIFVKSKEGIGSTFTVELPKTQD
ncbi:PAS domain-containing sensor histidine kinase [Jeotgalicoccus coquinae]|uniref:Sensor protein kinase WalK n=1 Tax=Jeotgalicoccus coquinae TaxID=709509 RepID=A0A6V7RN63_9STAP|nr:ATP-binding protein [Jeotgalicoccus coquinae]MBB6422163.1 two-component system phosphate regulon sensor histidine kinase PhoR [Jeotgalicoccus coquinae]GGE18140.1 PAS domain-containing sensor histidine kinase [Jeotgalicoccus coquinae]CAD2079461.1 Alkaline phosphatase synthesis sensor protein PhoR [Jeotgalicoccus coquinae]